MAQKLLSITLGTSSAKLAEIVKAGKKIQVFSAYDIPISENLCDDGVILDVDALADELKQYLSKYKIKTKKLVFSIASKRIASKEVVIPFVKEKQIKGLVEMNAADYFPVGNINEYAINYSIIETVKTAENMQYRLNVIATPNEMLEKYELLAKALKCTIEFSDYAGNAMLQVLKQQAHLGEIDAILQLGYENTVINIMNGSVQIMQRSVATGLNNIINAVAESVGLDEEDATAFLEDNDISRIASAYPDVKYVVDSLVGSIGRIFEFYNGRSQDHPIVGVRFIGDATFVNGIGDVLSEGLGYEAEEILRLVNVQVKNKAVTPEFATNFMANIGSIIAPMNLKYENKEEKDKDKAKDEKLPWGLVVISFVASIALAAGSFAMYYMAKTERDRLAVQLNSVMEAEQIERQLDEAIAKTNAIEEFYKSTKGPNDSLLRLINDMEDVMPKGMSIDNFLLSDGVVTINGGCEGKGSVARFIQQMRDLKYVEGVKVDLISESIDGISMYDSFNMSFRLLDVNEIEENEAEENAANESTEIEIDNPTINSEEGGME